MKSKLVFVLALAQAASVLGDGDPYSLAIRQARGVSAKVEARQNETQNAMSAPPQAVPPAQPPANPALEMTKMNISNIAKDLEMLQSDPSKKQPLINDLNAAPQGRSPSKESVAKITGDFAAGLAGKNFSLEQRTKLGQYLRAFFNSSHVSPAQQQTILADIKKILESGGVASESAGKITDDFKAIAAETK